jgi:hypothetical protein
MYNIETALSILVHRYAPFEFDPKEFLGPGDSASTGHKRYHPIWHMVHKLRVAMGKRDGEYVLAGRIELDEGYFSTIMPTDRKDEPLKRSHGARRRQRCW